MTRSVELKEGERDTLIPVFNNCRYDRVLIDSVLEGNFGFAHADSAGQPTVARLDSGAFTMLAGDTMAASVKGLLEHAPIYYVTPQNNDWRNLLLSTFDTRINELPFTDFSSTSLDLMHLADLVSALPTDFKLMQIDKQLAEQLPSDIGNEYFFENFRSIDDFLGRGIGFCILHQGKIVSAATSMAQSSKAIDIEIETLPGFRKQHLGTAVGAKLVSYCLKNNIEPRWLAANTISENLAHKLGYVRGESYVTYEIH